MEQIVKPRMNTNRREEESLKYWKYPGARWWKFDFHAHTPASADTEHWQKSIGTEQEVTPEKWLLRFMAAGIDCVAITDHNSGVWIDRIKTAYEKMKSQSDNGSPPEGFRELTLFPGVEISANGGVHILAIFDPNATTSDIDALLGAVGYQGTRGNSDGETNKSAAEVIAEVLKAGAIPIPAHADDEKGLLRVKPGTKQCSLSANTIKQVLEVEGLLAIEWCSAATPFPEAVEKQASALTRVLGSDCHSFQGNNAPGSRYTWVKMAKPTLEGLRLALLDGNGVSILRSEEGSFDPFKIPAHIIRAIEINKMKVMGHGKPARFEFSPYFNAVVGGRGTGKSTMVHALRIATQRENELEVLPEDSEPYERFQSFRRVTEGRDDPGALRQDTEIRVEWQTENSLLRVTWQAADEKAIVEEWQNDQWQQTESQAINASRFPLRLFSQGQIIAMAGKGRLALLNVIDEAAGVESLQQNFEEARRAFLTQRTQLREIEGKLTTLPEVKRRLQEVKEKLNFLKQGDQAAIQQAYAQARYQEQILSDTQAKLHNMVEMLRGTAKQLILDEWPPEYFGESDVDLLQWRREVDAFLTKICQSLEQEICSLEQFVNSLESREQLMAWNSRIRSIYNKYEELQKQLASQGVSDSQAFTRLTQEQQELEKQVKTLQQLETLHNELVSQIQRQQELILEYRQAITQKREEFLEQKLEQNPYVRIQVVSFGFDKQIIEQSLRELIEAPDERFQDDIDKLVSEITTNTEDINCKLEKLNNIRSVLLDRSDTIGGRFSNYLERKLQKPEFADYVMTWFPEDDLKIQYQRNNQWYEIHEGSQGQRSAALLAFLLAFGEEPIVLDQPEDDLDNHLIYDLIVRQIRENKLRRQLIVITHNANVVVNGDAELVHVMDFKNGQCVVAQSGVLQDKQVREEVCRVMEGGREAFASRWKRLGKEI